MLYSECAYFNGDHCQHVADWQEHNLLMARRRRVIERTRRYS